MKQLLNTLFVTSEDVYLSVDGENVVASRDSKAVARYPLHTLQSIVTFSYSGASPALLGACAKRGVGMAFCSRQGRFLARTGGENNGNVLLRRQQYRIADSEEQRCRIARCMVFGKLYNARKNIERTRRDHGSRVDEAALRLASDELRSLSENALRCGSEETLRGLEGAAASCCFKVFDQLILNQKDVFFMTGRSRRPPLDPLNALLSFAYTLLAHDCASALESVGLDAYVGFLHRDRPGRCSLALDLMEELRPCMADRFVLTLINNRIVKDADFETQPSGAVSLKEEARKAFLKHWQQKKQEPLRHPYLDEKLSWGMIPYAQAMLLARHLRGDLDGYPPFLWK